MKKIIIQVPPAVRYISQWKGFLDELPSGKVILNKRITDCGASHFFLVNDQPVVLCCPRTEILLSKNRQLTNTYLFRTEEDSKKKVTPFDLKNRLRDYLLRCRNPFSSIVPKILVTYDSLLYVTEVLMEESRLGDYTVIVDEFQCIYTDAPYKGDTEVEFVSNLKGFSRVIYLSATPYIEDYLDFSPEFSGMTYVELKWPNTVNPKINYEKMAAPVSAISKLIKKFRNEGYFESIPKDGTVLYAREAVFFLNKVSDIISVIKNNSLSADEVNVLCSDKNAKKLLLKTGMKKGHAPIEGERHKTFTFATRCVFEGTDFYSTNAYTYIFADPSIDSLALDISLDIHQILGRQRLDSNPFKYMATLYYKTKLVDPSSKQEFEDKVKAKDQATERLLKNFESADETTRKDLLDTYRSVSDSKRFKSNYISVVDDKVKGQAYLSKNTFVQMAEIRAWEIQSKQYGTTLDMLGTLGDEGFIPTKTSTGNDAIDQFLAEFRLDHQFPRQMKCYADFRDSRPDLASDLDLQICIPSVMAEYYRALGSDKLRVLKYREDYIKKELNNRKSHYHVAALIAGKFSPGTRLTNAQIKADLQEIYDSVGLKRTAKAKDIFLFDIKAKKTRIANSETGKRDLGYEFL